MSKSFDALRNVYGPTPRNYVLTVLAKQIAFSLESKGFSRKTEKSDTNGAPVSEDDPLMDASLNCLAPMLDGVEKRPPFNSALTCEVYGAVLVLSADAVRTPMEWGRCPDAKSFSSYFSQPGHWLKSKIAYWEPRLKKEAKDLGETYGASADAIVKNQNAKIAEFTDWAKGIASTMAAQIKLQSKQMQQMDTEEIVTFIEEHCPDIGIDLEKEVTFAARAFFKSRREKYEAGVKINTPQPGLLKLFSDLGVTAPK